MSRADDRRAEKKRRHRMSQNGGIIRPGQAKMAPTQAFLAQLIEQNQLLITLTESLCRLALGQTAEEIRETQGISFPIKEKPTKEELIEALQEEMDRLAEEEGDTLIDAVPGPGEDGGDLLLDDESNVPQDVKDAAAEAIAAARDEQRTAEKLAFIETEAQADALEVESQFPDPADPEYRGADPALD